MKLKFYIDSHKGVTALFVLLLMALYSRWGNQTAWLYLALHGTYGLLWVLKSRIFPDSAWEQPTTLSFGLLSWAGLSLYWVAPWLLIARDVQAPGWYIAICAGLYAVGLFFHFASDMQKHTSLKLHPNQLITDGLFARLRNPNYFGELLIYAGFGLLAMHWLPPVILLCWVLFYWLPRMRKKDKVLAKMKGWEAYRAKSKLFIPYLF